MTHLDTPRVTATDMTLVLGAESYVHHHQNSYNDPWGRACLRDFVDLVLNSEKLYFTLPGKKNKGVPTLIRELKSILHKLPDATIDLASETEEKIFGGFVELAERRSELWLWDWLKFQLTNPIVTKGHRVRVGSMMATIEDGAYVDGMISGDGYAAWKTHFSQQVDTGMLTKVPPIKVGRYLESYLKRTKYEFSSDKEFFLCYAFDVYRRGWQYMSRVAAADVNATYFPHRIRDDALEAGTDKWQAFRQNQAVLWSWGEYITSLLDEYKIERTPERVAERILKIRDAMIETKCPRWFNIGVIENDDPFRDGVQLAINKTVRRARLPRLRIREDPEAVELVETLIGTVFDFVGVPAQTAVAVKVAELIVKLVAPEFVGKVQMDIEEGKRGVINAFHKGRFGYPGLMVGGGNLLI